MKKQLFSLIALGLLFITASAYAQTVNVKANIPFDFAVDQQTMPRGEYKVETISTGSSQSLLIRSTDGSVQKVQLGRSCELLRASESSKMVFHRYGDRYFLAQVWTAGNSSGYEFSESRLEKELAKASTATNVSIASLR